MFSYIFLCLSLFFLFSAFSFFFNGSLCFLNFLKINFSVFQCFPIFLLVLFVSMFFMVSAVFHVKKSFSLFFIFHVFYVFQLFCIFPFFKSFNLFISIFCFFICFRFFQVFLSFLPFFSVGGNALLPPRSLHARPHDNTSRQHSTTHRVRALTADHPGCAITPVGPRMTAAVRWGRTAGGCGGSSHAHSTRD